MIPFLIRISILSVLQLENEIAGQIFQPMGTKCQTGREPWPIRGGYSAGRNDTSGAASITNQHPTEEDLDG